VIEKKEKKSTKKETSYSKRERGKWPDFKLAT
jgi:hypothetical protein